MAGLLWTLIVILVAVWIILMVLKVSFWAIHILIVAAVILFIINLFTRRRV